MIVPCCRYDNADARAQAQGVPQPGGRSLRSTVSPCAEFVRLGHEGKFALDSPTKILKPFGVERLNQIGDDRVKVVHANLSAPPTTQQVQLLLDGRFMDVKFDHIYRTPCDYVSTNDVVVTLFHTTGFILGKNFCFVLLALFL